MTTTAQNTKISPNFPARKYPGYVPSPQTLGRIAHKIYIDGAPPPPLPPHRETRPTFPILRNEQIQNVYKKSQKIQNTHKFFFFKYTAER